MRVAVLTPLPPSRTGVAHYSSLVVPALATRVDVQAFESLEAYRRSAYDTVIYQLGNNPHHEVMFREAMREPGIAVIHDLVLHHLIVEMTLARGDVDGYVNALEASHGAAGAAWARGRAAGLHSEMGNFLLPASIDVAQRSRAVIVHNEYARARLESFGVTTPIHVVPHPYGTEPRTADAGTLRQRLGIGAEQRVIGFFGFLTSAKRAEVVLEAFRAAHARDRRLVLLVVGEPAPNIDITLLAGEGIVTTGYVADEEFASYYAVADRLVNLRYPSAGETSGTLIRALAAGKPVAVSDYAQFAEYPDDCVFKVPLDDREVDRLTEFFLCELGDVASRQHEWLERHASPEQVVGGYMRAIVSATETGVPRDRSSATTEGIALFPDLELVHASADADVTIAVRNIGKAALRARTYGHPEYRLIAKIVDGETVVQDRWLALPHDLAPQQIAEMSFPLMAHGSSLELRLYHALQDVANADDEPWESIRVR